MRVVFLGPPGSGKGTYAQLLSKKGWVHFSMGQALREHVAAKGKFAKKVDIYLKAGKLVPPSIFFHVFDWFIRKNGGQKIIFDGLPRNLIQARKMVHVLQARKTSLDAFVFIDVPQKELVRRLSQRRQCITCGKVYGENMPPKQKGLCDADGGKLIQRDDDKPAIIRNRFNVYEGQTFPLLEWAAARFPVFYINGQGSPALVFKRISRVLSLLEIGKREE